MATSGGFGGFAVDSIERIAQTQAEKSSGQKSCSPASAEWIAPNSSPGMLTETYYFIMLYLSPLFPWDLPQFFKFWKNEEYEFSLMLLA